MRFLFQMRPLEDGIFLDVGAGGHAEHFIVVTGADAASGTLPREVVLVDDLPGGDVAVGDEGAAGVLAGGLLGGQRFDAHFPDHGQRPLEILAEELARRDLNLFGEPEDPAPLNNRIEEYMQEFEANGLENLSVDF